LDRIAGAGSDRSRMTSSVRRRSGTIARMIKSTASAGSRRLQ
jgi:hypothetical protein